MLYREYCKLIQLEKLSRIYEELKDDIESFLELYRVTKAAGMTVVVEFFWKHIVLFNWQELRYPTQIG